MATIKKAKKSANAGSRWGASRTVSEDWKRWAAASLRSLGKRPIDLDVEAIKFENYWASKAGQCAKKVDWKRTWLVWCLNDKYKTYTQDAHSPSSVIIDPPQPDRSLFQRIFG